MPTSAGLFGKLPRELRSRRRVAAGIALTAGAVTLSATAVAPLASQAVVGSRSATVVSSGAARLAVAPKASKVLHTREVPSERQCHRYFFATCYDPQQFQSAYDVAGLPAGTDGTGTTIAVVDAFGSPTIRGDLRQFDRAFGLPRAQLSIAQPAGQVPRFDPQKPDRVDWATETTLDVEYAHVMAPGAKLLLLETPVDETEGAQGLPQMMHAERWAIRHAHVDVISQSFGATEQTFPSFATIRKLRATFAYAQRRHVTVLAASGDNGATDLKRSMNSTYSHRVQSWPSADPLVTSVGGLHLDLTSSGKRRSPDQVWHDDYGAGGGGRSIFFPRPSWQRSVRTVVGSHRGVPDVSMTADVDGGALIWTSFKGQPSGWQLVGGTSLATPMFAGVVALADQLAGHPLGLLNPAIYRLGRQGAAAGLVDVTRGNNSYAGVRGFNARRGFDLASGWGTVDAGKFVPALVAASG